MICFKKNRNTGKSVSKIQMYFTALTQKRVGVGGNGTVSAALLYIIQLPIWFKVH